MSKNTVTGLFAVILGVIYVISTMNLPQQTMGDAMGPKVFPLIVGILLTFLGLMLLLKDMLLPKERRNRLVLNLTRDTKLLLLRIIVSSLAGIIYGFLLDPVGYLISTALFMLAIMFLINKVSRWKQNILVALGFSFVTYVGFATLLHLSLPRGIISF